MTVDRAIIEETQNHLNKTMQDCISRLQQAERECASLTYQLHLTKQLQRQADRLVDREMWELEEAILTCRIEAASHDINAIEEELMRTKRLQEIVIQHVEMTKTTGIVSLEGRD